MGDVVAQRDALRHLAVTLWQRAGESYVTQPDDLHELFVQAGLAEEVYAQEDNVELEISRGDPIIRLTELGKAALDHNDDGSLEGRLPKV